MPVRNVFFFVVVAVCSEIKNVWKKRKEDFIILCCIKYTKKTPPLRVTSSMAKKNLAFWNNGHHAGYFINY